MAHDPAIPGQDLELLAQRVGRVVRARRAASGRSLGELGRASGLSKTILARIERGEGNPSMETLWRISKALDLPLGALLAEDRAPRVRRIPSRSGELLEAEAGTAGWLVHAEARERRCELYDLDLPAGREHRSEPHLPGTEETVTCVRGRMRVGPAGEEVELEPGDAAWFSADVPHGYVGLTDARALCLMLYPPAGPPA
jgi:XRE family transcriptional regulator, regulator of sulfur utilization